MKTLLGTKLGMTQLLAEDGKAIPVTLIQAGPVTVTQVKTVETDGYNAVQVAFGEGKNLSKAVAGHVKPAQVTPKHIRDFRDATGTSKGKGFAGTIKRHNFKRHRKTHGGKGNTRKPGSIGSMYPQKVFKGKTMAGHMGHERVTVKNLEVVYVDPETNLIGVKGAVPGPRKGLIILGGNK